MHTSKSVERQMRSVYRFLFLVELQLRLWLVNAPAYLLERFPEVNRLCALFFMYFLLLFVGLVWAFTVNAGMSVALTFAGLLSTTSENVSTLKTAASFYVTYATFKLVISFGKRAAVTAWESLDDFPSAAQSLVSSIELWWYFTPLFFMPLMFLTAGLLAAPFLCQLPYDSAFEEMYCTHTALSYMTLEHRPFRKTVTTAIFIMLLQLVQALLHQFPQWRGTLRNTPVVVRYVVQWTLCLLSCITVTYIVILVPSHFGYPLNSFPKALGYLSEITGGVWCIPALILMWIFWLQAFVWLLIQHGRSHWQAVVSVQNAQRMFRHMRLTLFILLVALFFAGCLHPFVGFPEAQLQLTICTIIIPAFYVVLYLFADNVIRLTRPLVVAACIVSLVVAVCVFSVAGLGGPGSFSMLFLHVFGKFVEIFGKDSHDDFESELTPPDSSNSDKKTELEVSTSLTTRSKTLSTSNILEDTRSEDTCSTSSTTEVVGDNADGELKSITSTKQVQVATNGVSTEREISPSVKRTLVKVLTHGPREIVEKSLSHLNNAKDVVLHGLAQGAEYSPLVQIHSYLGEKLRRSRLVRAVNNTLMQYFGLIRTLILSEDVSHGLSKAGAALAVVFALLFGSLSFASIIQTNLDWFPDLIDFENRNTSVFIDHAKIATLHLYKRIGKSGSFQRSANFVPKYALCDMDLFNSGLTLFDYSLLAEVAYFDNKGDEIMQLIDAIFPKYLKFSHVSTSQNLHDGRPHAMYTEVHSATLNLTVLAIRGTDLGRLSDFVEDMKLWTEPLVFLILSTVFPTVRLWPDETAKTMIQLLQETLDFFGLKNEAEYYKFLVKRLKELKSSKVVLTGHSLGGGLGHVVGSMTDVPSIAFSPPGLGQSYRKYSVPLDGGYVEKSHLHHMKISIVPEYDFVPMVDSQIGLIQRILCDKENKAHQNACHMMEGTLCNILNHCGDSRNRFTHCEWSFEMSEAWPYARSFLYKHLHWVIPAAVLLCFTSVLIVLSEIV